MSTGHRLRRRSAVLTTAVGTVVLGLVAVASLTTPAAAAAVAAVAGSSPAVRLPAATSVSSQQMGCHPRAGVTTADTHYNALLDSDDLTGRPFWLDRIGPTSGVTALGSASYVIVDATQRWYIRTFAVRNGSLTYEVTTYPNTVPTTLTSSSKVLGPGWGNVTKLVDAADRDAYAAKGGWLYALNPTNGTLSRYSVSETKIGYPVVRSNASKPGYAGFRSLALAYRYRQGYPGAADVLIGTTRAGALYLITIPASGAFAPRLTLLRASTWAFDDLVVGPCDNQQYSLLAVRRATKTAYLYRIDTIAGTSSRMRAFGAVTSDWDFTHTSGAWIMGAYPTRW